MDVSARAAMQMSLGFPNQTDVLGFRVLWDASKILTGFLNVTTDLRLGRSPLFDESETS